MIAGDVGELEETEVDDEQLATHTLTVEATEEISEYYCERHRDTMVGEIESRS